jgi:tetratricopeptide (TPR) repeat protein
MRAADGQSATGSSRKHGAAAGGGSAGALPSWLHASVGLPLAGRRLRELGLEMVPSVQIASGLVKCEASKGGRGTMPTLRLVQEAVDPSSGTHRIAVEFEGAGPRLTATAQVRLAMDQRELERLRWYLEEYLEYPIDPAPTIAGQVEARLVALGRDLFAQVFADREATRLWDRAESGLAGTRVEVVTDVVGATAIPWELLRDPLTNTPLALRADAFVRTHSQPARLPPPPQEAGGRLRILLVICRPGGADDVPFRSVASHLVRVSADARQAFDLDVLRPPTFARLGQVLQAARDRGEPYQVVHFDGHGIWADLGQAAKAAGGAGQISPLRFGDARGGAHGYLLFEDPDVQGNVRYVNGPELGDLLAQAGVGVLVLNACRSAHAELATTPEEAAAQVQAAQGDPHARARAYGSLAQEVIDAGVAGVVAMRYSVYVVTAARFVGELYASLLAGLGLGAAVSRGRQLLAADPTREVSLKPLALQDWMVPVVYEAAPLPMVAKTTEGPLTITVPQAATGHNEPETETILPGPPEVGFYGRDETLLALDRAFDTQQVVLLHAYAGAGKTTTAAEFARWYQLTGGLGYEGGEGPVLFTSFEQHRPLARVLDQFGELFQEQLEGIGIHWLTLDDLQRRQVAVQVLNQVPVLWIWDNVEPVAGFPTGTPSAWTTEEQQELRGFLAELRGRKAKVLLTSRRDERALLGNLPARVRLPPMPMGERVQLARALAAKQGHRLTEVEDWWPLLAYSQGNPLTVTVLVGQALRDNIRTRAQVEALVARLQAGEQGLADDEREGRTRSLGASLSYGFSDAFDEAERAQLALLHLFQGFVEVAVLYAMGNPELVGQPVEAVVGLTPERGIRLLDRAAEVGLLTAYGEGLYGIHPALPWYFQELFTDVYGPAGCPAALQATRAYTTAIASLGGYYNRKYQRGRRGVVGVLGAEEANLLQARRLARDQRWWDQVLGAMQGLLVLYQHTGRNLEWARLVEELVLDLVDPATDGPWPGLEEQWSLVNDYRVSLATQQQRDYATAERLQRIRLAWDRERAAAALTTPAAQLDDIHRDLLRFLAVGMNQLGEILREQQQPACVQAYSEALQLARRIGDRPLEAIVAYNLGHAYAQVPEFRDLHAAARGYQDSLGLRDEGDRLGRARCVSELGYVHRQRFIEAQDAGRPEAELLSHLNAAAHAYQQALDMLPADAVGELAVIHGQLGNTYHDGGQPEVALRHWQESIRYREAAGNRYGAAQTRFNVAAALVRDGRLGDGLLWAQAALRDFQTYGDRAAAEIAQIQQLIATIDRGLGGGKG